MAAAETPTVGVIMGSKSDWEHMSAAAEMLTEFKVPHEVRIMSAHRTPAVTLEYAATARDRGLAIIIAGAGGAAHLAGVVAAHTVLPVIGVPMPTASVGGIDSLLSTVQMPGGVPVGTLAIGRAGAVNAGLLAASILAITDDQLAARVERYREEQTQAVAETPE